MSDLTEIISRDCINTQASARLSSIITLDSTNPVVVLVLSITMSALFL